MSNQAIKRLVGGLGTALILVICAIIIGAHFMMERNLQRISIPQYVNVASDGQGGYAFSLDVDRMIFSEHLIDPPASEQAKYPEIAALKTLGVRATERDGAYAIETISTSTDTHFNETLKKGGIKLVNTQWTWTREQIAALLNEDRGTLKQLRYSDFIRTKRDADGKFDAALDLKALMQQAGVSEAANPETDPGARALRSLGIACTAQDGGYLLQATSTLATINDDLTAAGVQIIGTSWTWTAAEMEAHLGTVQTPAPYTPSTPQPQQQTDTPEQTPQTEPPQTHETPEPTAEPTAEPTKAAERNEDAIDTLYGFDQTDVRKAIRAAKEAHYGSSLESASVKYNYFAVGDDATEHANVFRIVYAVTTSKGTEYLIADVYDLENETGYKAADVNLRTVTDSSKAKSTDDLSDYEVHKLDGGSMVFAENGSKSPFDGDGLVMAKSLNEKLTYDELWDIVQTKDMTLLQLLGYARNEMFARAGHKFKDTSNYYKYYKQFKWYEPTGEVTANDLAAKYPKTKDNINTIKFLEKLIKEG